jgi:hypothetical protein
MADTTRTDRPAEEPARDAAVEGLVDALTAPGTPEELAVEEAYVAAFLAARNGRDGTTGGRGRRARPRLRIALVGGVAAFAVTGTAAALTGSLSATGGTEPAQPSRPVVTPTIASIRHGTEVDAPPPWTPARSSPSSAGATTTPAQAPTGSSAQPAPSPPRPGPAVGTGKGDRRGTGTGRPSPAPTPQAAASAFVNFCRQFGEGRLPVESAAYRALAAAAGSAHAIPVYCASLGSPPGRQEP